MVVHSCNPNTREAENKGCHNFKVTWAALNDLVSKTNNNNKRWVRDRQGRSVVEEDKREQVYQIYK